VHTCSLATNSPSFLMGHVWTAGKNRNKLLSCQRKTDTCGIVLLLMFEALKWYDIAYKDVISICWFHQSPTNQYQFICWLLLKIDTYQSPHESSPSIGHGLSISIDQLIWIGIDWYRLSLIIDFISWIPQSCCGKGCGQEQEVCEQDRKWRRW